MGELQHISAHQRLTGMQLMPLQTVAVLKKTSAKCFDALLFLDLHASNTGLFSLLKLIELCSYELCPSPD